MGGVGALLVPYCTDRHRVRHPVRGEVVLVKDPMRYAKKELVKYGATVVTESAYSVVFDMPYGGRYTVGKTSPLANIRRVVAEVHERFNPLRGFEPTIRPKFDLLDLVSSAHFRERFELMAGQEQLTTEEVARAIRKPDRVLVSTSRRRYAFERGRVIVIGQLSGERLALITVLWATEALWARNPRTEGA